MAAIEQICLPQGWRAAELWPAVARQTQAWLLQHQVLPRDTVVLVPFAALLNPAREAFAALGGWQPRVETVLTLSSSLGPPAPQAPGACTGDPVLDRLTARALMLTQPWAQRWARDDPGGFEALVGRAVDAAQTLRRAALERHPAARAAFWERAREELRTSAVAASAEAGLLQLALEWAHAAEDATADRVHAHVPGAWVLVRLGGPDMAAEALVAGSPAPALRVSADPSVDTPFTGLPVGGAGTRLVCEDFESEAQAAANDVLDALRQGVQRVGLVALDRELAHRVVALLQRHRVPLVDETGWVLATTPAAASLMALLRAASNNATDDARLEWLKSWPAADAAAVDVLEALWRGRRVGEGREAVLRFWAEAQAWLEPLAQAGSLPLADWQTRLAHAWLTGRAEDPATAQVAAALRLPGACAATAAWAAAAQSRFTLAAFTAWVQATLEGAPFLPLPDSGAQLVITPLARAYGRGFEHVVMPGADARRLAGAEPDPGLLGDRARAALGLPHAAEARQRQVLALAHVLRTPRLTLLRRHRDADEPLAESPLVEWWLLALAQRGLPWPSTTAWQAPTAPQPRQPVTRPLPTAAERLPARLSATRLDALRACPYRFFAQAVLRLDEPKELEAGLEKRDYGDWLHAVLYRFHAQGGQDEAALRAAAEVATQEAALDEAELLPWRASFETLVPAYIAWWQQRQAQGWRWVAGEADQVRSVELVPGLQLQGRIDRLDEGPAAQRQLLDYKTGSVDSLKAKLKQPLEDTQLAFYAALMQADADPAAFAASYLALDDKGAPVELVHEKVGETAQQLLNGLAQDWQRLREGAPLQALGEGALCDYCEARGLCRRDHWAAS